MRRARRTASLAQPIPPQSRHTLIHNHHSLTPSHPHAIDYAAYAAAAALSSHPHQSSAMTTRQRCQECTSYDDLHARAEQDPRFRKARKYVRDEAVRYGGGTKLFHALPTAEQGTLLDRTFNELRRRPNSYVPNRPAGRAADAATGTSLLIEGTTASSSSDVVPYTFQEVGDPPPSTGTPAGLRASSAGTTSGGNPCADDAVDVRAQAIGDTFLERADALLDLLRWDKGLLDHDRGIDKDLVSVDRFPGNRLRVICKTLFSLVDRELFLDHPATRGCYSACCCTGSSKVLRVDTTATSRAPSRTRNTTAP